MAFAKTAWSVVVGGRDGQPEQPRRTDAPAHPHKLPLVKTASVGSPPAGHERCGRVLTVEVRGFVDDTSRRNSPGATGGPP